MVVFTSLQSLGYSTFLDSLDGQFTLAVQQNKPNITTQENATPALEEDLEAESAIVSNLREGINFLTIQNLLKSIGTVRSFKFLRRHEDKDGVSIISLQATFQVLKLFPFFSPFLYFIPLSTTIPEWHRLPAKICPIKLCLE